MSVFVSFMCPVNRWIMVFLLYNKDFYRSREGLLPIFVKLYPLSGKINQPWKKIHLLKTIKNVPPPFFFPKVLLETFRGRSRWFNFKILQLLQIFLVQIFCVFENTLYSELISTFYKGPAAKLMYISKVIT